MMPEEAQSTDQQPSQKEAPVKTPHKINWIHILIGVVLGAGLLGAGFGVYLLTQSKDESTAVPTKVSTPSASKDETSNWKTYTNSTYNFTFKYDQEKHGKVTAFDKPDPKYIFLSLQKNNPLTTTLTLDLVTKSVEEIIKEVKQGCNEFIETKVTNINGILWTEVVCKGPIEQIYSNWVVDGGEYRFHTWEDGNPETRKVLATFEFLD